MNEAWMDERICEQCEHYGECERMPAEVVENWDGPEGARCMAEAMRAEEEMRASEADRLEYMAEMGW